MTRAIVRPPNPLVAGCGYLEDVLSDHPVTDATGTLQGIVVYGAQIEPSDLGRMPFPCVMVRAAGGLQNRDTSPERRCRVDTFAYNGWGVLSPWEVGDLVFAAFKAVGGDWPQHNDREIHAEMPQHKTGGQAFLYDAWVETGPYQQRDPDGDWPVILATYSYRVSTVAF